MQLHFCHSLIIFLDFRHRGKADCCSGKLARVARASAKRMIQIPRTTSPGYVPPA